MGCQDSKAAPPGPVGPTLLPRTSNGSSATLAAALGDNGNKNVQSHVLSTLSYQHASTPTRPSDSPRKMVSSGATPLAGDSSKSGKTVSFHLGPPEDIISDSDREVQAAAAFQHGGRHLRAAMPDSGIADEGVVVKVPKDVKSVTWLTCHRGGIASVVERVVEEGRLEVSQDLASSAGSSWKLRKPLSPAAQEALQRHHASKYNFLSTWTDGFLPESSLGAWWPQD